MCYQNSLKILSFQLLRLYLLYYTFVISLYFKQTWNKKLSSFVLFLSILLHKLSIEVVFNRNRNKKKFIKQL